MPSPLPHSVYNQGKKWRPAGFLDWGAVPNDKEDELADTRRADWVAAKLAQPRDKPFFLAVGFYAPHFPNYCPQKYFDLYDPKKIKLPRYKVDDLDDLPEKIRRQKINRSKIHQRLEELNAVKDALHGYLACMSYADAMVGRVLDALARSPHADNTIVVLWSDHGYHHGQKGHWGKHTLWERTSNVPFVWAGPGIARGGTVDATVSLIDIYPTLVQRCGLPRPAHQLEGVSLAAALNHPADARDRSVLLPYLEPGAYAIINRNWRYIRYADDTQELYNLQQDPHEWTNLAVGGKHETVMAELRQHAPASFAKPGPVMRTRDLVIEGETFRWPRR